MKMDAIQVGQVYRRARNEGRAGISITGQHIVVDAVRVSRRYLSGRYDGVQVHNVTPDVDADGNFKGTYTYTGSYDAEGNPLRFVLMAKEIVSLREAEAIEEERRKAQEERKRRVLAEKDFETAVAKTMAARLGIDHNLIMVSSQYKGMDEEGNFTFEAYRASVSGRGLTEMMQSDPDPILIAEILDEIEPEILAQMSSEELANHIVGGLRYDPAPDDSDE